MEKIKRKKIAGVVLCGGQSMRMGRDKAGLVYHGVSLFERAIALLFEADISDVFYSSDKSYCDLRAQQIVDIDRGRGPLGGLYACLEALDEQYSHLLIIPVDMPLLESALIRRLSQADYDCELLCFDQFLFPLRVATTRIVKERIRVLLAEDDRRSASIKGLLTRSSHQTLNLETEKQRLFVNVNTPTQWKDLSSS